jgi:hypothetical protein
MLWHNFEAEDDLPLRLISFISLSKLHILMALYITGSEINIIDKSSSINILIFVKLLLNVFFRLHSE